MPYECNHLTSMNIICLNNMANILDTVSNPTFFWTVFQKLNLFLSSHKKTDRQ
jgi:hypothetical protein